MGLMLSVLVVCVGVVELLTFFYNVKRNVQPAPVHNDLTMVRSNYMKDLVGLRDRIYNDLQAMLGKQPGESEELKENSQKVEEDSGKVPEEVAGPSQVRQPLIRLNTHEDIEIEYKERLVASSSRSKSPRRFLLTEKDQENRSRSPSPRHFIVDEEPAQGHEALPEYVIQSNDDSSNQNRFVLKDSSGAPPEIPLPNQFLVSEPEEKHEVHRRSSSPYPPLEVTPRLASEVDHSVLTLTEIDEEAYRSKSPTPEPSVMALELQESLESTTFNTTEYWDNKLSAPKSKSRSVSPGDQKIKSCEKLKVVRFVDHEEGVPRHDLNGNEVKEQEPETMDSGYLNDLDGVPQKTFQRNRASRKSIKKRKGPSNGVGAAETIGVAITTKQTIEISPKQPIELENKTTTKQPSDNSSQSPEEILKSTSETPEGQSPEGLLQNTIQTPEEVNNHSSQSPEEAPNAENKATCNLKEPFWVGQSGSKS